MTLPAGDVPDAAWLDRLLGDGGWTDAAVEAVRIDEVGVGVGLLGTILRLTISYARPVVETGQRNPASLVVKLPSPNPANRSIARYFGYYEREAGVYRHLLPRPGVAAAVCYGIDETTDGLPVLLLQDLGELREVDQIDGAGRDDALAAADLLAGVHAAFWDDQRLRRQRWLPGPTDPVVAGYGELFDRMWPMYLERFGDGVDGDDLAAAPAVAARFDQACTRFAHGATTLVHGDLRLDNLRFADRPHATAVALDWQLAAWGRGPYDLAFFAAGSLDTTRRRAIEDELVERYHRGLCAAGVRGYRLDDCWDDYRWGHVLNLPNPVTAAVAVDPGNERGARLLEVNARRALAAVRDHWG